MNKIVKGLMFLSMGTFLFSQNILTNPSFEDSLSGWNIWPTDKTNRSIEKTGNDIYGGTAGTDTVTARYGSLMLKTPLLSFEATELLSPPHLFND